MEELDPGGKWKSIWEKYRYVLLVAVLGLGLMLLPESQDTGSSPSEDPTEPTQAQSLEVRLERLLSSIEGVGQVSVLLTEQTGSETSFQTDTSVDRQAENVRENADTVIVEDDTRREQGLIRRVDAPVYRGAVVACQGAASARIRLEIIEAVGCVTGLRSDQISVVKMK